MINYSKKTDDALVELTLLGDERAFEALVARHEKTVMSTAMKVTGNRFSAQDAAQDAFIAAWIKLDTLADFTKFRPWLCAIARNCARSLSRRYRAAAESISLDSGLLGSDLPDAAWDDAERTSDLREMVGRLDQSVRQIVELHYFDGYSAAEIAEKLKIPVGTVKWRLSEGRKQLREGYGSSGDYDENEKLVRRVMREVERLKLWKLREDKSGFVDEYRHVLEEVSGLDDSEDKHHAMADLLMMGLWWIDAVPHAELLERIKLHAEAGGNEEAIAVIALEEEESRNASERDYDTWFKEVTERLENVSIPYYRERGHGLAAARLTDMLLRILNSDDPEKYRDKTAVLLDSITELIDPSYIEHRFAAARRGLLGEKDVALVICEDLRVIDGKYCVWETAETSPDYFPVHTFTGFREFALDGVFYDPAIKPVYTANRGEGATYSLVADDERVTVPAGSFDGCRHYKTDMAIRNFYPVSTETWFKPGVGVVMQKYTLFGPETEIYTNELTDYITNGGGAMPLGRGSVWEYVSHEQRRPDRRLTGRLEIVHADEDRAITLQVVRFSEKYPDTWEGDMLKVRDKTEDLLTFSGSGESTDSGEEDPFARAEARELTPLQSIHTRIARRVFERIMSNRHTRSELREMQDRGALDGVRIGQWDWFGVYRIERGDGFVKWTQANANFDFSYSPFLHSIEGQKIMHNQFMGILCDSTGYLWSDKWVPGYEENYFRDVYGMKDRELRFHFVRRGETVTTPAGTFDDCVHIQFDMRDLGALGSPFGWRGGWADYWFAPGVGVVRHFRLINNTFDCFWQLTEYRGTGEGYFPAGDGFFRRYEPADLGEGFRSSLELTFAEEDGRLYVFADGEGSQDASEFLGALAMRRREYEKEITKRKERVFNGIIETARPIVEKWDPYGLLSGAEKKDDYSRELASIARAVVYSPNDVLRDPYAREIHPETLEKAVYAAFESSIHPIPRGDPHFGELIGAVRGYLEKTDR